jgi:hypothetical protein
MATVHGKIKTGRPVEPVSYPLPFLSSCDTLRKHHGETFKPFFLLAIVDATPG